MRRLLLTVCLPLLLASSLVAIPAVTQSTTAAAAGTSDSLGMRPSGGFLNADRLAEAEQYLGRPISWYVGMAGRQNPGDMRGSVFGQMKDGATLPAISDRINLVMTVPLAFGTGSARDQNGRNAIRKKLNATARGDHDSDYRDIARQMVNGGFPDAVIRLGHEFTGAWFPWSSRGNEDAYIAAFRHVHDVMAAESAAFRFDWNGARNSYREYGPAAYPGDRYVDVVSLDIYYEPWKGDPADLTQSVWTNRYQKVLEAHRDFALSHGKALAYPEWANGKVDEPRFIEHMKTWFDSLPSSGGGSLLYHSYFNVSNSKYDLNRYPATKAAYIAAFGGPVRGEGSGDLGIDPGSDVTVEAGEWFDLSAIVTGANGDSANVRWWKVSGKSVKWRSKKGTTATVKMNKPGIWVIKVLAKGDGERAVGTVTVTVVKP